MNYPSIISYTDTEHIVGTPGEEAIKAHSFRITTLCGFSIRPKDAPSEATRDCQFCLREWKAFEPQEQIMQVESEWTNSSWMSAAQNARIYGKSERKPICRNARYQQLFKRCDGKACSAKIIVLPAGQRGQG